MSIRTRAVALLGKTWKWIALGVTLTLASSSCGDSRNGESPTAPALGPPRAATIAVNFGETALLPYADGRNGGLVVAQLTSTPQLGRIQSLSFYVHAAAGTLRLGVYDATGPGGGPGNKLAEVPEFTPVVGWNTRAVTTPVVLPAANYWLAYFASSDALSFRMDETGSGRWYALPYGPLPATFATNPSGGAHHWSFYGTLDVETIDTPNAAPTIATAASATPSTVTGSTTALSVRGADDAGEPALTYRWNALPGAPGSVTFSDSGTNSAQNVTATFNRAGNYTLRATVRDAYGLTATSDLNVTVTPTATSIALEPTPATIVAGGTLQYQAIVRDQFAQPIAAPPTIAWSTSGGGTIDGSGLFTASLTPSGPFTITASVAGETGALTASTAVSVVAAPSGATLGETTVLPTNDNNNRNILSAQRVTLNAPGTLQSLSIYVATASGSMRLGLYDATGPSGGPGARLAQSANLTAVAGWNTAVVTPVALPAGTYWLAFTTNSNALTFRSAATGSARWYARTYQSLPATFASVTSSGNVQWSFYATLTNVGPTNNAPTVASAAMASVGASGTEATLAVLGEDDAGESALTYTWTTVGTPPGSVTFSTNGTNAAKQASVSVTRAGDYVFRVTIADALGLVATSDVQVRFNAQPSTIEVSPASVSVLANSTQSFTAVVRDQFAQAITPSPTVAWTVTGGGVIDAAGSFTAGPAAGGPFTATATVGAVAASATLTVTALPNQPPTIASAASAVLGVAPVTSATLTVLGADDAGESALTYLWSVVGAPAGTVQFSENGSNAAQQTIATFTRAGTYEFQVRVSDAQAQSATSTVTVSVSADLRGLSVSPSVATVLAGATQAFAATGVDQFAQPIALGPTEWTVTGGGSISTDGIFTAAPVAGGPFVVTAAVGELSGTASMTVSALPNAAPTIASAEATLGAVPVTSATLSTLAADDAGEPALSYTWVALGDAPGSVTFSVNGNNAAKTTSVAFTRAGTYELQVTATDAQGLSASRIVSVTIAATPAEIRVAPTTATVLPNGVQDFSATVSDQFAQAMTPAPGLAWSVAGGGSIDAQGRFTASAVAGGPFTVSATAGAVVGTASISVSSVPNQEPTIATGPSVSLGESPTTAATLSVSGIDDGGEASLMYTWRTLGDPPGPVQFSENASNAARRTVATFSRAGEYLFAVMVTDAQGLSASGNVLLTISPTAQTLTVSPATASLAPGATQSFSAVITDQFAQPITPAPSLQWATSGGGVIDAAGLFTATASGGGPFSVTASAGTLSGTASVTITSALNQSPTLVTAATAIPGPAPASTAALSVLGADDAGESTLTYTWASVGTPPAAVTFAANGTNAAKNTTATFTRAGSYELQVTIADALGLSTTSAVTVVIAATPSAIVVAPATATVAAGGTQAFAATVNDQFSQPISPTPSLQWATSGGGAIDAAGLFTAAASGGGPFSVTASVGALSGAASVSVTPAPNQTPTVATAAAALPGTAPTTTTALSVLGADDADESTLTYTWASVGTPPAAVTFAANATNAAKVTTATFTRAGSYELQVTITDTLGLSATSVVTVVINATPTAVLVSPPTATVVVGGSQTFTAAVNDQFGQPVSPLPALSWATTGGGTISASGLFTATTAGGPFAVTATLGSVVGTAAISVSAPANQPPTIATPIATPASTINGTTAALSVLGADDGGAAALQYTWSTIGAVAAPVGFSPNGSNAASATTATFTSSGSYTLQVAITDAQGLSATSSIAIVVNLPTQGPESGLDFPGNVAVESTMRFKFTDPHLNGLPAYGPNGSGVTYIWRAYPRQQAGYYTTFFWGNDDGAGNLSTFYWRGGSPDTYYGAHPYPRGSSQSNVHDWEISTDEADFVNGEVVYGRWYTQALRVWSDAAGKHYEFYWDLPNTDAAHRVVRHSPASYGNINPPAPALTFGDAPWRPGEEVWNGILRGIQIYSGPLTLEEMLNEANTPLSTQAGASAIWYLNSNPTPSDISDKSGRGHNPVWVGSERPTLYTGGPIGPSNQAPTITAAATPSANPVNGTTVTLSALGADDQGEPTLLYDWSTVGTPPGPVSFSANGTNGAKTTVASFSASGIYTFRVTVRDSEGLTATSNVSVTVNPQTSSSLTFGESTLLPNIDGGNGNLLVAMQAAVPQGGTLQSLSFYITNAVGQLRLGVYDASGPNGGPGALVATTAEFTPVVGWNTVPSTTAVTLPTGTYWLAYLASSSSLQFLMTTNGSGRWYSVPFGALPSTFSTSPSAGAYHWSFYGTLSVVP